MHDFLILIFALASIMPLTFCFFFGERIGFLSPVTYILVLEFIGVFIQSWVIVTTDFDAFYSWRPISEGLLSGYLLVLIFNSFYFAGWVSVNRPVSYPVVPFLLSPRAKNIFSFAFFVFGIALMYQFLVTLNVFDAMRNGVVSAKRFSGSGDQENAYGYLRMGGDIVLVFGLMKLIEFQQKKNTVTFLFFMVSILSAAVFYFLLSSRMSVLMLALSVLIILSANDAINRRDFFKYAALFFLLVAMIFAMGAVRKNKGAVENIKDNDVIIGESVKKHLFSGNYFFTINKAVRTIEAVPTVSPYMFGETFLPPFYFFIPKSIWPEKPKVRYGPEFAKNVYGLGGDSGIPPSFPVELYWNFGWVGVAFGGGGLGICSRLFILNTRKKGKKESSFDFCLYIVFLIVPLMSADFAGGIIGLIMAAFFYAMMKPRKDCKIGE